VVSAIPFTDYDDVVKRAMTPSMDWRGDLDA